MKKEEKEIVQNNIANAIKELEKEFGKGAVITSNFKNQVDVISTGSLGLDIATGIMGLPKGKIVECMGWESSGKSTSTLELIAQAQLKGEKCLLVDGENSFDRKYAIALGVKVDDLLISQPSFGEEGYTTAIKLMNTGEVGVVIFDSQTSLLPRKIMEGEPGQSNLGLHARLLSEVVPKIMKAAEKNNVLVIFISQFREKIGCMYGDPTTTNGGHAIQFYAHIRLRFSKTVNKDAEEPSNKTKVKVIKNKMAPPFLEAEFDIIYGKGIDKIKEIIELASENEILYKHGQIIKINKDTPEEERYDLPVFMDMIENNPEFYLALKNKILKKLNII